MKLWVFIVPKKDRVWIHVDAEPILDSDGNVRQVVCTFVDFTTRKKAEEELILKNLVFEESIAANSISDVNGIITNINSAFIKIWGYNNKEEVIGKPISEFLEYENETAAIINSLSISGKYSGEYTARKKDNSTFHAFSLATVVYDNSGNIIGYQSSVQDITARHLAESALRESEEKYRTLIEVSLDAIFINQDNKITYINSSGLKLLGAEKPEQILGKSPFDIFHPDFHKIIRKRIKDMIEKNSTADLIEEKIIRLDGVVVDVEVAATPFVFRNKKALQVILRDITQRKKAEETLKNSYTLLSTAGRVAKFGGWNVIMSENRSYWSDEVAAIHEMPAGYCPLVSEGISFYAPEFKDKITKVFTECSQNGIPYDEEMQIITPSGKRLWVRTNGEAVRDKNGKIYKVQGFFQDITEQRLKEKKGIMNKVLMMVMQELFLTGELVVNNEITDRVRANEEIQKLNNELEERALTSERIRSLRHSAILFLTIYEPPSELFTAIHES
ncbi:MAG: PAS domain S-box protein [Bacteroidetes bacterium]|nr:PAS domain S-box protein [Bacteroidota bacterium]